DPYAGNYAGNNSMPTFIANAAVEQSWLDNALKPMLQDVAASPYRNYVYDYDIGEEVDAFSPLYAIPISQVQAFVHETANYIHTDGGGAYAIFDGGAPARLTKYFKGLGVDYYQLTVGPGNEGGTIPSAASWGLDKPVIAGEYGASRSVG